MSLMRNSLFMPQIEWAESRMRLTFLTARLSPIFRVFVPQHWFAWPEEFGNLGTLELSLGYPQGNTRAAQPPHDAAETTVPTPRGWPRPARAAPHVLLQSGQTCRAIHIRQVQVLDNSTPHISLYTCLKPSGRCTLPWKTYSFSHFSIFSSSVEKKKKSLVGKKM